MKTVGEVLAKARKKKRLDIGEVAEATKIRPSFLRAIEKNNFIKFSSFSTTRGFIKNYAEYLDLSSEYILAVFRRDFAQNKRGKIIPRGLVKPLDEPGMWGSPKIGVFFFFTLFLTGIIIYLGSQYFLLMRGPFLEIISPQDKITTEVSDIEIIGKTELGATVSVNGRLIDVSSKGEFTYVLELTEGKNLIIIEASNRLGKTNRIAREVTR